jgi:hypothetical protein
VRSKNIDTRERAIYLGAFLVLAVNRVLARKPEALFDSAVMENPDHPAWIWMQAFMIAAIIYAIFATWRIFRHAGFGQPASIVNAVVSPLLWPLIMLPQAIVVFRRLRKRKAEIETVLPDKTVRPGDPG